MYLPRAYRSLYLVRFYWSVQTYATSAAVTMRAEWQYKILVLQTMVRLKPKELVATALNCILQ